MNQNDTADDDELPPDVPVGAVLAILFVMKLLAPFVKGYRRLKSRFR